jgi:Taurine catabolism dioxygenase TauD, TfdA family
VDAAVATATLLTSETAQLDALRSRAADVPEGIAFSLGSLREPLVVALPGAGRWSVESATPSPVDLLPAAGELSVADGMHFLLAAQLGIPYGFASQQSGRIINHAVPLRGDASVANLNSGSNEPFDLHTEDAIHEARPDVLTLRCIRNLDAIPTLVSTVQAEDLAEADWQLLREPAFLQVANPSQGGARLRRRRPGSLVSGPSSRPSFRVNTCALKREHVRDVAHYDAYVRLREALVANAREVTLHAGEILFLDNATYLHGRGAFTPRFDGTDRWLHRIVVRRNFDGLADVLLPGTHVVRPNHELATLAFDI